MVTQWVDVLPYMETVPYMEAFPYMDMLPCMVTYYSDFDVFPYMETLPYMDMLPYMETVSIYGNTTVDVFPYMETVPIYGYVSMYVLVCPTVICKLAPQIGNVNENMCVDSIFSGALLPCRTASGRHTSVDRPAKDTTLPM